VLWDCRRVVAVLTSSHTQSLAKVAKYDEKVSDVCPGRVQLMTVHEYRADGIPMGQRTHTKMQSVPRQTALTAGGVDGDEGLAVDSM
jgi:hypothetical protein